jgi:hypothetical protein
MKRTGIIVLAASVAAGALLLLAWLAGLVFGFGGSLIHLLLVLFMLIAPAGCVTGIVLIILGARRPNP